MPLHVDQSGPNLHQPRGVSPTPLTLVGALANAYLMEDEANLQLFNVNTSSDLITLGASDLTYDLALIGDQVFIECPDDKAAAIILRESASGFAYLQVNSTNASPKIILGNINNNPELDIASALINLVTGGVLTIIRPPIASVDVTGGDVALGAGAAGAVSAAVGKEGGDLSLTGGVGSAGDVTFAAGPGGEVLLVAGAAGADGGAGGDEGGSVQISAGAGSGAGANGFIHVGILNTARVILNNGTDNGFTEHQGTGDLRLSSQIRITERSGDPTNVANTGFLYTKDVSTLTELFFESSDGTVTQLTPAAGGGGAVDPSVIPSNQEWPSAVDMDNANLADQLANEAMYIPFHVNSDVTIKRMTVWIATTSGNIDVGIYELDGTRLVSSGSTAVAAADRIQIFDISDTALTAGRYYMAIVFSAAAGTGDAWRWINKDEGNVAKPVLQSVVGIKKETSALPLPATATFADPVVNDEGVYVMSLLLEA